MEKRVVRNPLAKWETAEDLAYDVVSNPLPEEWPQLNRTLGAMKLSNTVHGPMTIRFILRGADGKEVRFPADLAVEAVFVED